jgi:hypothetical protein
MTKKLVLTVVAALVLALVAGLVPWSDAQAQSGGPLARFLRARPVLGQVTAIGQSQFTIKTRDGTQLTFKVDNTTLYRSKDQGELAFSDLKIGNWVGVVNGRFLRARSLARVVVLLPEDFDLDQFEAVRGKVVSVNSGASQFTLEDIDGQDSVVTTDSETIFRGQVTSLTDLKVGMQAGVVSKASEGDGFVARIVRAGDPVGILFGEITGVNQAVGSFTLKPQSTGQNLTVSVNEVTRFRSKDDQLNGLEDLRTGMFAIVVTKSPVGMEETGTSLTAVMVAAGERSDLPQVDLWISGRVVTVGNNSFTVENREGERYSFQTTRGTRFRSREVWSLAGMKTGMMVLVGVKDLENESYLAQIVFVLPHR